MDANGRKNGSGSLLNGHSLAHLTGASVQSRAVTETRMPASRLAEALEHIARLGVTGSLQLNFHRGKALDIKLTQTRDTKADM